MNDIAIKYMIKRHEGYEKAIYKDTLGNLTVGYGHLLREGQVIDREINNIWFDADYARAKRDFNSLLSQYDVQHIGPVRKAVIIDMLFNLGLRGVLSFRHMLAALMNENFEKAADEMEKSRWHGQVKDRAIELVQMMRTGMIEKCKS